MTILLQGAGVQQAASGSADPIGDALRADAVAYYKFDEESGTFYDSTAHHYDIDVISGAISDVGQVGNSIKISNINHYAGVDSVLTFDNAHNFSVSGWVKMAQPPTSQSLQIIQAYVTASELTAMWLYVDNYGGGDYPLIFGNSPTDTDGINIVAGQWYFFTGESNVDTGKLKLTVNNSTIDEVDFTPNARVADRFRVGFGGTQGLLCQVDELLILYRAFTSDERTHLWNSGAGRALFPAP